MTIRTILVPVDGSAASIDALEIAMFVSNRFGAHVKALHVVHSALEAVARMSDRMPASMRQSVAERARSDAQVRALAVKSSFDEFCRLHGIRISSEPEAGGGATAEWVEEAGEVAEVLVRRARLSDLVVVSRPRREDEPTVRRSPAGQNLEAILMGAGRPLLIVPPGCKKAPAQNVVIGWNESQEAARALSLAIPWLPQMASVTVAVSKKREARVNEVLEYLAWHGIQAQVRLLEGHGRNVAESMLEVCQSLDADILVVGGYSHARARELLFGGVTRQLLGKSTITTLMVH